MQTHSDARNSKMTVIKQKFEFFQPTTTPLYAGSLALIRACRVPAPKVSKSLSKPSRLYDTCLLVHEISLSLLVTILHACCGNAQSVWNLTNRRLCRTARGSIQGYAFLCSVNMKAGKSTGHLLNRLDFGSDSNGWDFPMRVSCCYHAAIRAQPL